MKEFELTLKLHNNLLKQRRLALGLTPKELARKIGIDYNRYLMYENLRTSPLKKDLSFRLTALKIADFYFVQPEELWPDAILAVKCPTINREIEANKLLAVTKLNVSSISPIDSLLEKEEKEAVSEAFKALPKRLQKVLEGRIIEGKTFTELANEMNCSRARVQQLEFVAHKRIRFDIFRKSDLIDNLPKNKQKKKLVTKTNKTKKNKKLPAKSIIID